MPGLGVAELLGVMIACVQAGGLVLLALAVLVVEIFLGPLSTADNGEFWTVPAYSALSLIALAVVIWMAVRILVSIRGRPRSAVVAACALEVMWEASVFWFARPGSVPEVQRQLVLSWILVASVPTLMVPILLANRVRKLARSKTT
jgi:hypothetical protein